MTYKLLYNKCSLCIKNLLPLHESVTKNQPMKLFKVHCKLDVRKISIQTK